MKKAVIVGYGGIGKNVYDPQLIKLGYHVFVVDPVAEGALYKTVNEIPKDITFDIAVVCCPNIHHLNAVLELTDVCKKILVEKPGLANTAAWNRTVERFPDHKIVLVKNNLYRQDVMQLDQMCELDWVEKVDIKWMNKDRIPNPGSWFTTKEQAFGGVTHDLFPHLFCFMYALFPLHKLEHLVPKTFTMQRWNLKNIGTKSDYGVINQDGTYDVCDYAEAHYMIQRDSSSDNPVPVTLTASWKEGYDDQSITIYYKDGSKLVWPFGLCPDEAYGEMLKAVEENRFLHIDRDVCGIEKMFDKWIHAQLEYLNED